MYLLMSKSTGPLLPRNGPLFSLILRKTTRRELHTSVSMSRGNVEVDCYDDLLGTEDLLQEYGEWFSLATAFFTDGLLDLYE